MLISSIKAIVARCILGLHAFVAVWRTTVSENDNKYWLFLIVLVGVFLDLAYVLVKRKGQEWKWFSPSIFFYLGTAVPCIWVMEFRRLSLKRHDLLNITSNNETVSEALHSINPEFAKWASQVGSQFDFNTWVNFIEQAMLLLLIIARWMLPVAKEDISRDQLSQLLLVYLGLAADILELLAIFDEPQVLDQQLFVIIILAFWSWSLMQFTLVLTATRARGFSVNKVEAVEAPDPEAPDPGCFFCDGEIWSILIMCFMLDLPFLSLRLTAMIYFKIGTYTIYFFTCKNVLVVMLQGYRLMVVCASQYHEAQTAKKEKFVSSDTIPSIELDMKEKSADMDMDMKNK